MTDDELVQRGGWWKGTAKEWHDLPLEERDELSFKHTGCLVAYPSWETPVECVHTKCQIRRGELPPIALTEAILAGERESGWLRWVSEERFEQIRKACLKVAEKTGEYDPWKLPGGWQALVYGGLGY